MIRTPSRSARRRRCCRPRRRGPSRRRPHRPGPTPSRRRPRRIERPAPRSHRPPARRSPRRARPARCRPAPHPDPGHRRHGPAPDRSRWPRPSPPPPVLLPVAPKDPSRATRSGRSRPGRAIRHCYLRAMAILRWINRLLARGSGPTEPASSAFGSAAERRATDQAAADAFELEVEKQKGRPPGVLTPSTDDGRSRGSVNGSLAPGGHGGNTYDHHGDHHVEYRHRPRGLPPLPAPRSSAPPSQRVGRSRVQAHRPGPGRDLPQRPLRRHQRQRSAGDPCDPRGRRPRVRGRQRGVRGLFGRDPHHRAHRGHGGPPRERGRLRHPLHPRGTRAQGCRRPGGQGRTDRHDHGPPPRRERTCTSSSGTGSAVWPAG